MAVSEAAVLDALKVVQDPDLHRDIVALGFVKDLKIDRDQVAFTIDNGPPGDRMGRSQTLYLTGLP